MDESYSGFDGIFDDEKEEAMKDYFNRLVKQAQNERIISNLSYAPLAVALLDIRHRLKEWELSLDVSDQFRFESVEEEKKFLKIWQQLMTMIENRHQQTDAYTGVSFSLEKEENQVRVGVRSNEASFVPKMVAVIGRTSENGGTIDRDPKPGECIRVDISTEAEWTGKVTKQCLWIRSRFM